MVGRNIRVIKVDENKELKIDIKNNEAAAANDRDQEINCHLHLGKVFFSTKVLS